VSFMPRTLAGRVFVVIIAGLVVAHLASFLFFRIERAHALERQDVARLCPQLGDISPGRVCLG